MKNILLLSLLLISCARLRAGSQGHFQNFAELAAHKKQGTDYDFEIQRTSSPVLVMAFHGGLIEPGTTELGKALGQYGFNFYSFVGLTQEEMDAPTLTCADVHLTSARFDEPQLQALTAKAQACVTLHGFGGVEADFCVGGASEEKRRALSALLAREFPDLRSCELCCPPFNGTSAKNPANQCRVWGVQIEMSPQVRKTILTNEAFKKRLAKVLAGFMR